MGRGVRANSRSEIEALSDAELESYIAQTAYRAGAMTKAALRNSYRRQLEIAKDMLAGRKSR